MLEFENCWSKTKADFLFSVSTVACDSLSLHMKGSDFQVGKMTGELTRACAGRDKTSVETSTWWPMK